jgi:hypothetical protein
MSKKITPDNLLAAGWNYEPSHSKMERRGRRFLRKEAYKRGYWMVWLYEEGIDGIIHKHIKASSTLYLGQSAPVSTMRDLEFLASEEERS